MYEQGIFLFASTYICRALQSWPLEAFGLHLRNLQTVTRKRKPSQDGISRGKLGGFNMLRKRKKGKNSPVYMNERTQWEALPVTLLQNEKRFVQAGGGRVVPVPLAAAWARGLSDAGAGPLAVRDTRRGPPTAPSLLPLLPPRELSKGQVCQHHLLLWKNRMTKKILNASLIPMDFNAVWHLEKGWRGGAQIIIIQWSLQPFVSALQSIHTLVFDT